MNCEEARCLAALAVSEDVTPLERRALESHAAECPDCSEEAGVFESLREQMAAMRTETAPSYVYKAVRMRVMAEVNGRRRVGRLWPWPALAAAVACGVVLVVAVRRPPPMTTREVERPATVARVAEAAPEAPASPPRRRMRRPTVRTKAGEPDEPMVVQMFTNDPDVFIYWIADAKRNGSGKVMMQ